MREVRLAKKKKKTPDGVDDRRRSDTGVLLAFCSRAFNDRTAQKIQAAGHGTVRVSHLAVMRNMDEGGTRITELARRAGMTKQAMGQLVREFQELGYIVLRPDPTDRRAKLATYTELGRLLAEAAERSTEEVQADFKKALGKGGLKELRKSLSRLADRLKQT